MDKNKTKAIELNLSTVLVLILIAIISLPYSGFKLAEWYYVRSPDALLPKMTADAQMAMDNAKTAKQVYVEKKEEIIQDASQGIRPVCLSDTKPSE